MGSDGKWGARAASHHKWRVSRDSVGGGDEPDCDGIQAAGFVLLHGAQSCGAVGNDPDRVERRKAAAGTETAFQSGLAFVDGVKSGGTKVQLGEGEEASNPAPRAPIRFFF